MAEDPISVLAKTNPLAESNAGGLDGTVPRKRARRSKAVAEGTVQKTRGRSGSVVVVKEQLPSTSIELRKAVEALTIRNVSASGEITFLQRKAYNAMLQIAQSRSKDEITFEVPIAEFESLVGHTTSNSRDYLKQMLRQLASIQVEFDYKGSSPGRKSSWGVANMVAEVYISEEHHTVKFSFPPELKKRLLDPEMYNRIDMRMQNLFTSYSALTLYEIVSRYYGFAQRETFREHWSAWSVLLSGSNQPHTQFRDFNKMLNRAIEQVNAHETRFKIVPHVLKRDRKVDKLWFVLEDQQQSQFVLTASPTIVSEEVLKRLRLFGLSDDEITNVSMQFDEEYLLAQADYTDKRMKKKGAEPLTKPKEYFLSSIDKNYANAPRRPPKPAEETPKNPNTKGLPRPDAKQALSSMKEAWRKSKVAELRDSFYAQNNEKQLEILAGIEEDLSKNQLLWQQYKKKGLTKMVEAAVFDLIIEKNCPEPTAEELLEFALETGSLMTPVAGAVA